MTWYVNVNKHTIRDNALRGTDEPPVRISRGKSGKGRYCHEAVLPAGSKILYNSQDPILKCGARLVIECPTEPEVIR
jgi:hypothetical protein